MTLKVLGLIIGLIFIVLIVLAVIIGSRLFIWFHWRECKYCHHSMEYKGFKEDSDSGHYLFHCLHCGAWEQVPIQELYYCLCDDESEIKTD